MRKLKVINRRLGSSAGKIKHRKKCTEGDENGWPTSLLANSWTTDNMSLFHGRALSGNLNYKSDGDEPWGQREREREKEREMEGAGMLY